MNIKLSLPFILIVLGVNQQSQGQIAYNKMATGSIGTLPKAADFQNSASLENVDMSTGTLKIGIPLYEIKVNDITVPISLNYSALGLKVGQESGPAGMGWELSAGGKIVTNAQGRKDGSNGIDLYNQSWSYTVLNNYNVFDPYAGGSAQQTFLGEVLDGKKDAAWDTYNYILPTGGGTFTKNGLTFPYDPTITFPYVGQIKTTDGLIYDFTSGQKRVTTKKNFFNSTVTTDVISYAADAEKVAQDLDLERIISTKFKDTVFFSYDQYNAPHAKLLPKARVNTSETLPFYRNITPKNANGGAASMSTQPQWYKIMEPIICQTNTEVKRHTRISGITYPNGKVEFIYEDIDQFGRDALSEIKIYQKTGSTLKLLKKYVFEYDSDRSFGNYLSALHIYNDKEVWQAAWDFTYNGKLPVVPGVESKAQDRWGFYNGITSNKTLLENPGSVLELKTRTHYPIYNDVATPGTKNIKYSKADARSVYGDNLPWNDPATGNIIFTINFASRLSFFNSMILGTLKSVKMPTGGKIEYEYESHQFTYLEKTTPYNSVTRYESGGGIRIKSIRKSLGHESLYNEYYLDTVKTSLKKFTYGDAQFNGSGSETSGYGIVTLPGNLLSNISKYYDGGNQTIDYDINNIMLLSHPVNNLNQLNGSYVMYKSVTEIPVKNEATGASYGKTVYYSDPIPEGYRPDAPWNGYYATPESPLLPIMSPNPGVEKAYISGISGIKKFASLDDGGYRALEYRKSYFESFMAPQTAQNKLVSFFAAITGEMNGPYPTTNPQAQNIPKVNPLGGGHLYLFDSFFGNPGVGVMDYLGYNRVVQESSSLIYPNKYIVSFVDLNAYSNCIRKTREEVTTFDDHEYSLEMYNRYFYYDNPAHLLPTRVATVNTRGDSVITRTKYAQDFPASSSGITDLIKSTKLGLTDPLEEYVTYKPGGTGTTSYLKSGTINTFKSVDGSIMSDKVYKMKIDNESTVYTSSAFNGSETSIDTNKFKPQVSYDLYVKGNVHKYTDLSGPGNIILWGYDNQYPIAKATNSKNVSAVNDPHGWYTSADIAYTSFERPDKGNWTYAGAVVADTTGPSGKKVYKLENGAVSKTNGTPSGVKYIISYWYKNGATVNVSGGTVSAAVNKNTWGDWTLAEREVTNATGTVTVSGTGYIDELRFHPYDSQMSTYLYEPLIGLTGVIDAKGNLQFYEYDDNQRLRNIRDQRGNLVKSYRYQMGTLN